MNKQEVFNTVWNHLNKQGEAAMLNDHECQYRTPDGKMCAVGCLIPDGVYEPCMEGQTVRSLLEAYPDALASVGIHFDETSQDDLTFLSELQNAHDHDLCNDFDEWQRQMETIAANHNLTVPEEAEQ